MKKQSHREAQTKAGNEEKHKIVEMCLEAEQLTLDEGSESSLAALENLAHLYPHKAAPRMSLAKLYRWLAFERNTTDGPFERSKLRTAADYAKRAVAAEDPSELAALELASDLLHLLAEHEERAHFFSSVADRHQDPAVSLKAFTWASVAFQCRGMGLEAEGKDEEANSVYHDAVEMHRRALQAWPEAPVAEKLSTYCQGGHVSTAYSACGLADQWVREVEALLASEEGSALSGEIRADYLGYAGEMAVEAGLYQKAINLAEKALRAKEGGQSASVYRFGVIGALGCLLIAHHSAGDGRARESVAERIEGMLCHWEEDAEEDQNLSPEIRLPAAYNIAAVAFTKVQDWERAIRAAKRAAELWDFGPNHWYLAVSLWAGRRDREGALSALRNAARDRLLSGRALCTSLRDDFMRTSYFRDVQEDEDFLAAIKVTEWEE